MDNTPITSVLELAKAMRSGKVKPARPGSPYPQDGYGFEFDKGVHFRYWPADDEPEEEVERKMEEAEQVFNLEAAYVAAGIEYGNDDCEAFVSLLLHELGIGGTTV